METKNRPTEIQISGSSDEAMDLRAELWKTINEKNELSEKILRRQVRMSQLQRAYDRKHPTPGLAVSVTSTSSASRSSSTSAPALASVHPPLVNPHICDAEVELEMFKIKEQWWLGEKALLWQQLAMAQEWRDTTEQQITVERKAWAEERLDILSRLGKWEDNNGRNIV